MKLPSIRRALRSLRSPDLWLHIGLPKCGSTSIQHYLAATDTKNRKYGVVYPASYRETEGYLSHLPLALATRSGNLEDAISDIVTESAGSRSTVLSCEELSDALPGGGAGALVEALNEAFDPQNVHIVCYFRNMYEFIESSFAQFLTGGLFYIDKAEFFSTGCSSIGDFMNCFYAEKGFPIYSPAGFVRCIQNSFPDNRILFRSIERTDLEGRSLTEDFCRLLDLPHFSKFSRTTNKRQSNRRIAAYLYAQSNSEPRDFYQVSQKMHGFDFELSDVKPRHFRNSSINLNEMQANEIRCALQAERKTLESEFSTDVKGLLDFRWQPIDNETQLTQGEKEEVRRFLN